MVGRQNQKLATKFGGPFPIIKCISKVAYHVKLPSKAKIHEVFHVNILKSALKSLESVDETILFLVGENGLLPLQPRKILQKRKRKGITWSLLSWIGLPKENSTWVKEHNMKINFPELPCGQIKSQPGVM